MNPDGGQPKYVALQHPLPLRTENFTLELHAGANILGLFEVLDKDTRTDYRLVLETVSDIRKPMVERRFRIIGTTGEVTKTHRHVASTMSRTGYTWHLFETEAS